MVNAHNHQQQRNVPARELPDLSHHINASTRRREMNMHKRMYKYMLDPSIVSVGGGLPHPTSFPIHKATFELSTPPNWDGTPYEPFATPITNGLANGQRNGHAHANGHTNGQTTIRTTVGHQNGHANGHTDGYPIAKTAMKSTSESDARTTMVFHKADIGPNGERAAIDLARAQQYSKPQGFEPLRDAIRKLTILTHNPLYDFHQIPTGGNTDATTKIFKALLDRDDTLLVEEFEFAPPMGAARALGAGIKCVPIDTIGIVPEALDRLLVDWNVQERGKKPHVLYTVTTGQNPTSATMTLERARAVYEIAQKHDLIIVEDDPYFWLSFDPYVGPATNHQATTPVEDDRVPLSQVRCLDTFARSLPRSYLSIDIDGRVLRVDSFSKCFAPGMRTGWMTGNEYFVERIQRISETDNQEINGLSQAFFAQLLTEPEDNPTNGSWGLDGFARWICNLRKSYQAKRDRLVNAIGEHCSRDHIRCHPVAASGMFLWLDVQLQNHPDFTTASTTDLMQRCWEICIEDGILILQSSIFAATPALPDSFIPTPEIEASLLQEQQDVLAKARFLRASYTGSYEQLDLAGDRLGRALARFFATRMQ